METKPNIKFKDEAPRENVGSLLKLFSSQYFTIDMAIMYLYRKRREQGIHDYLINKLYKYKDADIDFYVPQLCYMLIKTRSASLERFLLDKCVNNTTLFLKIFWCLKAYGLSEKKVKKNYEFVENLITKVEMAMVNGVSSRSGQSELIKSISKGGELTKEQLEAMRIESERKSNRAEYLSETLRFINILVSISLKLKSQKESDRKPLLKNYVKRINRWLKKMRKRHMNEKDEYFRKLFFGIHIPFQVEDDNNSTQIVRILEEDLACFNTKKRAPYRVVVETIDMDEVKKVNDVSLMMEKERISETNQNNTMPEDNWDDILDEQKNWEQDPKQLEMINKQRDQDKYGALGDFNKIVKEQEQKLKDATLLKEVDLVQRLQNMQNKPQSTLGLKEESKEEMRLERIKQFKKEMKQPPKNRITRRMTVTDWPHNRVLPKARAQSVNNLDNLSCVRSMENFATMNLKPEVLERLNTKISELKDRILLNKENQYDLGYGNDQEEPRQVGWGPWPELWEFKQERIRKKSPFGHFKSYKLRSLIIKAADDLRQELIAMQVMRKIEKIWKEAGLTLKLRTYDILVTSGDSGILEFVSDTYSIDGIKKKNPGKSLTQFFFDVFGYQFEEAQKNFMDSLAGYSIVCYLLQIKDRHNGNILLDAHGHIVHIDFGFLLTTSPGSINFESAPFKMTLEYAELVGGLDSNTFMYFKMQLAKGFMELRKHVDEMVCLLQVMMEGSDLPCFENFEVSVFRDRFKESSTDVEALEYIDKLVDISFDNWRTVQYDNFQKYTNGIIP